MCSGSQCSASWLSPELALLAAHAPHTRGHPHTRVQVPTAGAQALPEPGGRCHCSSHPLCCCAYSTPRAPPCKQGVWAGTGLGTPGECMGEGRGFRRRRIIHSGFPNQTAFWDPTTAFGVGQAFPKHGIGRETLCSTHTLQRAPGQEKLAIVSGPPSGWLHCRLCRLLLCSSSLAPCTSCSCSPSLVEQQASNWCVQACRVLAVLPPGPCRCASPCQDGAGMSELRLVVGVCGRCAVE